MRIFLLQFLVLLMLTPGLACGGVLCAAKAQAATSSGSMADAAIPCHGGGQNPEGAEKSLMFMKDCAKVDLGAADSSILKKPDTGGNGGYAPVPVVDILARVPMHPAANAVRGPPPQSADSLLSKPSIILATHRFRE